MVRILLCLFESICCRSDGLSFMSKLLNEWSPSNAAIDLIKLNGGDDKAIDKALAYLKDQLELSNIDEVDGYNNWDEFFIVFCIKAKNSG